MLCIGGAPRHGTPAGSSLQVWPAADLPLLGAGSDVPLVVVNDEPTPLDDLAVLVLRGRAGELLPEQVCRL
jgi:NAD-dependent deacetylase